MIFKILLGVLIALVPAVALAEPISLSAMIGYFGGTGAFATIAGTAAFVATQMAIAFVAGKILAPDVNARDKDRKQTVQSGIEPRRIVYGETYNSGPMVYLNTTGDSNRYLHMIVALATHPSDKITQLLVNDEVFDLESSTYIGSGTDLDNYRAFLDNDEAEEKKKRFKNKVICVPVTGRWMYGPGNDEGDIERKSVVANSIKQESGTPGEGFESLDANKFKIRASISVTDPDTLVVSTWFDEVEILKVYSDVNSLKGVLTNQRHYHVSGYYYTGIPAGGTFKVWFAEEDVTSLANFYTVDGGGLDAGNSRTISGVTLNINSEGEYTVTGLPTQDTVIFPLRARYNGQQVDLTYTIIKSFSYSEIETGDHFHSITLTSTDHAFRYNSIGSGRYTLLGPSEINFDVGAYLLNAENVDLKFYAWEHNLTDDIWEWVEKPNILTNISNNFAMEEGNVVDGHGVQTTATLTQPMEWNETEYRLDRCTYVYVRLQHDREVFSGNIPNIAVKMRGKRLYNPLQDLSVISNYIGTGLPIRNRGLYDTGATYVPGDLVANSSYICIRENTNINPNPLSNPNAKDYWLPTYSNFITDANQHRWEYSNNWALATLDYLLDPFYGLRLDTSAIYNELDWDAALRAILDSYDGGYLDRPNNTIPASRFTNDEAIALLFPKFTVDGVLDTSTTPIQNLETLFTGAGGEMAYSQGKHSIYAGVYREAEGNPAVDYSIVIDESYLAGDGMSIDTALPSSDAFNIIQGVYVDNKNKGEPTEFDPLYSEEYIIDDGGEYITDVDYPMTTSSTKAQLLAIQTLEKTRLSEVVNLTCNFKIFKYKVGDVVFLKNDLFGYNENVFPSQLNAVDSYKQFKIIAMDIKENFEVEVSLQEISYKPYNPDFVWNIPPERELPKYSSIGNPSRGILRPTNFNIGDIYIQNSTAGIPQHNIDLSWWGPIGTNVTDIDYREINGYQIRYAPVGTDIFTQIPGQTMQETTTVPVQLSGSFVGGRLDSVTIQNPGTHYGYWADGQIIVNTSFIGTNPNDRAIIRYTVAGDGTISSLIIEDQGSSYANAAGVRLASVDIPRPTVANPGFSADDIHDWKDIEVVANNTRVQHGLVGLLLEQGSQDYAIGIRARAGDSFSAWTYGFALGGPTIQYNIEQVQIFGERVFKFLAGETIPTSTSIDLTAVLSGSLTTYSWEYWNGVDTWLPLSAPNDASVYNLTYDNPAWGTDTTLFIRCVSENGRSDSVNITKLYDGQSGTPFIEVIIPNNNHSIPMSADGTQLNYTGSGTLISAYFGTSQLQYVTGTGFPLSNNQFTVEFETTDVTSGSISGSIAASGLNAAVADLTAIAAQLGRITYTIRALVDGEQYTVTSIQNFTRVADGTDGYAYINLVVYQRTDTPIAPAGAPLANAYEYTVGDGITPINGWVLNESDVGTGIYLWKAIFTRVTNAPQTIINTVDWVYVLSSIEASNGFNTATLVAYKRSATAPVNTPGDITYNFTNASWGPLNGWSKTIPEGSEPVWAVAATALSQDSTDFIGLNEWSAPVLVFVDGIVGLSVATVYIYQRTSTSTPPPPPSAEVTYTFEGIYIGGVWVGSAWSNGVWLPDVWEGTVTETETNVTGLNNGWTATIPAFTGSNNYLWVTTATASSNTGTDVILGTEWGTVQKLSQDGSSGSDGRVVNLTTNDQSFVYNSAGEIPSPATSTLTATALNTSGTVYYEFLKNNVQVQAPGVSNIYVYTPTANYSSMPEVIEVRIREDSGGNPVLATDQMTLFGIQAGSDATSIQLTNEAHVLSTTAAGVVTYTGSGTDIRVFIGSTAVPYGTVGNFRFEVSAAVTTGSITISTPSTISSNIRRYGAHSNMTTDNVLITFTITVVDTDGVLTTYERTQSLSKSIEGSAGSSGSSALNIGRRMDRLDQWFSYSSGAPLTAWTAVTVETLNGPAGVLGFQHVSDNTTYDSYLSERITFDTSKKHRVSFWAKQTGNRLSIPFVEFYNSAGTIIGSATSDATGWPSIGTNTHNIFSPGIAFPVNWTKYTFEFGGDATATIPTGAATFTIGGSWVGGGSTLTTLHLQDFAVFELADAGAPGADAIVGLLSNESHTVAAASDGTGYELAGAGGTFRVWEGITDVTGSGPVYSAVAPELKNGLAISIDPGTGVYSLSGATWTSVEETFTLRAVYNGVTIDRVYTIVKSLAGSDGTPAKLLSIISTAQSFKYDGDDVLVQPPSIVFTATQQGSSATVNWATQRWNGSSWINTPTNRMSPITGLTSTLTEAAFDTQNDPMLRVVAWFVDGITYADAISIAKVRDGTTPADPIVGLLSNESHGVTAANNGTGYVLTGAGGTFHVWEGTTDVTGAGPVYSINGLATKNGLTISINAGTGVYSLSGASWTSVEETFTLRAVYNGVTIDRVYTIVKSLAGSDGTPAKLLSIISSAYAFKYDGDGVLLQPASIVFTATQQGSSATINWATQRWNGSSWINTTTNRMSPITGLTSTLTEAAFDTQNDPMLRVVAWFVDGVTYADAISIAKVQDGTTPADPIVGLLSNESHTVAAASDGTGYSLTTAGGTFRVWEGIVDVTGAGPVYSVVAPAVSNGLTISINTGTGVYSLTGASWTSTGETFTLRAVYNGVTIDRVYTITKSLAGGDGTPAKLLSIVSTAQSFKYDSTGALVPPSSIVFTATQQGSSATINWATQRWNGSSWGTTSPNRMSPTTGLTSTLTEADFNTQNDPMLRVVAWFVDGLTYSDAISIAKVQDGLDGTPGGSALNIGRRMNRLDQWFDFTTGLPVTTWTVETVNGPTGALGFQHISDLATYNSFKSEAITFDRTKKHRISFWAKQTGDRLSIPFVQFFNAAGTVLNNPGNTGWLGGVATHNIMAGTAFPTEWTLYTFEFGGDAAALIPANAVTLIIGGSWGGGGSTYTTIHLQDFQIVELAESGTSGTNITMVYIRSSTAPATPTTGPTMPPAGGWSTTIAGTVGTNALWSSVGSNIPPSTNWVWQQPVRMEGVLTPIQLADFASGIDPVVTFANDPNPLTTQVSSGGELVNYYFSAASGKLFSWSGAAYVTGPGDPLTGEIDLANEVTGTLPVNNADAALRNASISLSASGILTGAGSSSALDLGQLDGEVTAGQIAANSIYAEKLSVLSKHLVNPVTMTENLRGWGGILEDGTGTSSPLVFNTTEKALELPSSANHITRAHTFEIDNNKIYKITMKYRKNVASIGVMYTQISGHTDFLAGATGTTDPGSAHTFARYQTDRLTWVTAANPSFHSNETVGTSYADSTCYLIGANRSINDCPAHIGAATYPYIKVFSTSIKTIAFKILNWNNGGTLSSLYVKDISITEVGTGQIVAENIAANAITANKIAANAITSSKIAVVSPNLVRDVDTFDQYSGLVPPGTSSLSTVIVNAETSYSGAYCLKHTSTGANAYKYLNPSGDNNWGWFRVNNGKRYILSAYVKTLSATDVEFQATIVPRQMNTANMNGSVSTGSVTISSADGWTRISTLSNVINETDPSLTFYLRSVSSGVVSYWDAFQIEEYNGVDSTPSMFRKGGNTVISGGNITAASIHGDKITANTLDAGRISGGTISAGITLTNTLILSTSGRLYTNGKTSYASTTNGIFLGYDISTYKLNIGGTTQYLKWTGSALEVGGKIISKDNIVDDTGNEQNSGSATTSTFTLSGHVSEGNPILVFITTSLAGTTTTTSGATWSYRVQRRINSGSWVTVGTWSGSEVSQFRATGPYEWTRETEFNPDNFSIDSAGSLAFTDTPGSGTIDYIVSWTVVPTGMQSPVYYHKINTFEALL